MPRSVASHSSARSARVPQKMAFNRPAFDMGHMQWSRKELARQDLRAHRIATDSKGALEIPYRPVSCGSTYGIPAPYHWVYSRASHLENRPLAAQSWADSVRVAASAIDGSVPRSPLSPQGSFLLPSTASPLFRSPLHTPRALSLHPTPRSPHALPPSDGGGERGSEERAREDAEMSLEGRKKEGGGQEEGSSIPPWQGGTETLPSGHTHGSTLPPRLRLPPHAPPLPPLTVQEYWARKKQVLLNPRSRKVFKEGFQIEEVRHPYFG